MAGRYAVERRHVRDAGRRSTKCVVGAATALEIRWRAMSACCSKPRSCASRCPGRDAGRRLDARSRAGEFIALLGGNGAGKSLLLRTFAGLRAPARGDVRLGGAHIEIADAPRDRRATRLPAAGSRMPRRRARCGESVLLGAVRASRPARNARRRRRSARRRGARTRGTRRWPPASSARSRAASSAAPPSPACWCRRRPSTCWTSPPTISIPAQQLAILEQLKS